MERKECLSKNEAANKSVIAVLVKGVYDFNEYEISKLKVKEMTEVIYDLAVINKISINKINSFFTDIRYGKYGMIYRAPSDLIAKFYKYSETSRTKLAM
jgi:hypothetical protein